MINENLIAISFKGFFNNLIKDEIKNITGS